MKFHIYWSVFACILLVLAAVGLTAGAEAPVVNLMISADMPFSATEDEEKAAELNLYEMYKEVNGRGLKATIFSMQDFIDSHARLRLTDIGLNGNYELAMSGNNSLERLSIESFENQRAKLETSMDYVEACRVCGENEIKVMGFMPQSFDQNADTYRALDELGIEYDAGFQAGLIYAPGHEEDVWPYKMPDHNFYAVPVSSHDLSGERVPLVDGIALSLGLNSSQWSDLLKAKLDESADRDEPVVISLSTLISGEGDYLEALKEFLDYAATKNADFVTTNDLVNLSRQKDLEGVQSSAGGAKDEIAVDDINLSRNATTKEASTDCPSCEAKKNASLNASGQSDAISIIMEVGGNKTELE